MNHWILMGNPEDGNILLSECLPDNFTCWTTHKEAKVGDVVYFYITAPVSGIVAKGIIASEPELNYDLESRWYGYHFSDINKLQRIKDIPIRDIRRFFPDWAYWRYPRRNSLIPMRFIQPFLELCNAD